MKDRKSGVEGKRQRSRIKIRGSSEYIGALVYIMTLPQNKQGEVDILADPQPSVLLGD